MYAPRAAPWASRQAGGSAGCAVPAIGDEPDAPAPGLPEGIAKAFAEARGAMASLGAGDPDAPAKSAALALLRSLAEDQLSRTL